MSRPKLTEEERIKSREKRLKYLRDYRKLHWEEYYSNNREKILKQHRDSREKKKGEPLNDYNRIGLNQMTEQQRKEYHSQKMRESRQRKKEKILQENYELSKK